MSFNTDALSLLALGIREDDPVDPEQPPLPDGVHLRWFPDPSLGFPWHGFYLFRRESRPSRPRCLAPELRRFHPGPLQNVRLETSLGRLSSARPLVFTDDFPAAGQVEVDLDLDLDRGAPLRFDLPAGVEARRVDVRIGLRDAGPRVTRTCVDFRGLPLGAGPSPRTEKGTVFTTEAPSVSPAVALIAIEQWPGSPRGIQTTRRVKIALPCPAARVDLLITNRGELRIEALAADGTSAQVKSFERLALNAGTVTLTGAEITLVTIESATIDPALLHEICYECPASGTGQGRGPEIEVRALAGATILARRIVQGGAGEVVAATLEGEGITAVEIATGKAALLDLCVWPVRQGVTFGWDEVPGFQYPLCLPVADAGYPCPARPATFAQAQALAFSRVTYPAPVDWELGFPGLHGELVALVQGGPAGGAMAGRKHPDLPGQPLSSATQSDVPALPGLHPMELILLGSLQPVIAQMLGLYFVDTTAVQGVDYDYLLLADPTGVLGGSAASALAWLAFTADPAQIDAVLVLNRGTAVHPPIAPPEAPQAYALPGPAARMIDGTLPKSAGNVGLWWPLPADSTTEEQPDRIVFYYPKRASHGPLEPSTPPADSAYQPLRDGLPVLISEPDPADPPVPPNPRSPDWPPPSIPLHLVDGHLAEGWYSYRLSGQDLFGRRSGLGPPARWYEWTPASEHERHAFAVALLDKVPPPVPLGVEAWALDPPDRWVLADAPYTTWRKGHPDLVGLRVRWRWTYLQQIQAPDTREFRLYYQPGRWNALLGRVVQVTDASAKESDVDLDVADANAPGKFTGARLRVGNDDFAILGSQPGAHLRLRVKNIGVYDEIRPAAGKPCTVAIPESHALWVDTGLAKTWAKRLATVDYDPPLRTVYDPSKDRNGQPLTSTNVAFKTIQPIVTGADVYFPPVPFAPPAPDSPQDPDLSGLQPWIDHLWLQGAGNAEEAHPILRYDAAARTVTLKDAPTLTGSPAAWILGRPTREYEVFLPAPDVGNGNPFEPSLAEPAVYAQIAVSAADDKTHTKDDPKWNDPDRYGNESRLSPSATVFRVLQKEPDPPELVEKAGPIFATPADYHSRSYFTFRFVPQEHLRVHVLRALDESLFRRDWLIRETRTALDPVPDPPDPDAPVPKTEHLDFFPDGPPIWDFSKREAAAAKLNAIKEEADYANLTQDAWDVLALLPGNEGATADAKTEADWKKALRERDWLLRQARKALAIAGPQSYASLEDDDLRILAALPGNEAAFVQVTLDPLDMADPVLRDERRPDDDALYTPDPAHRRAYTDTLPGRATNRYFYRARFVDGAQNQSALSGPTLPVYLPKVEPPRTPVITKVLGGERQITIRWASNRESDLSHYEIYRTDREEAARDIRLMTKVKEQEVNTPPESREPEAEWVDDSVPGLVTFHYRLTAVDGEKNRSYPSRAVQARAFDEVFPIPPVPAVVWATSGVGELKARIEWSSLEETVLQCREAESPVWRDVTVWLPGGDYSILDEFTDGSLTLEYRIWARNGTGAVSKGEAVTITAGL